MRFYFSIFLMLVLATTAAGQGRRKIGVGISSAIFPSWNPGLPMTPHIFYRYNDHEFLAGPDLYGGQLGFASILGVEAEYRYHFYHINKNLTLFGNLHFQWVQFATGPARYVPYNYSEIIAPGLNYSMVKMRVFNNTLGGGIQYHFLKVCALYFGAGIGAHFQRNTLTEGVSANLVDQSLLGSQFTLGWMAKVGLSIRIWEFKK